MDRNDRSGAGSAVEGRPAMREAADRLLEAARELLNVCHVPAADERRARCASMLHAACERYERERAIPATELERVARLSVVSIETWGQSDELPEWARGNLAHIKLALRDALGWMPGEPPAQTRPAAITPADYAAACAEDGLPAFLRTIAEALEAGDVDSFDLRWAGGLHGRWQGEPTVTIAKPVFPAFVSSMVVTDGAPDLRVCTAARPLPEAPPGRANHPDATETGPPDVHCDTEFTTMRCPHCGMEFEETALLE